MTAYTFGRRYHEPSINPRDIHLVSCELRALTRLTSAAKALNDHVEEVLRRCKMGATFAWHVPPVGWKAGESMIKQHVIAAEL